MKKIVICFSMLAFMLFPAVNAASSYNIRPKSPVITNSLKPVIVKYRSGDYVSALMDLKEIVKKEPNNAYANYYMALCYGQLGFKDKAIEFFNKVLALDSNLSLNYYSKKAIDCSNGIDTPSCLAYKNNLQDDKTKEIPTDDMSKFIMSGKQFHPAAIDAITKERMDRKLQEEEIERKNKENLAPELSSALPTKEEVNLAYDILKRAGLYNEDMNLYGSNLAFNGYGLNNSDDLYSLFINNLGNKNNAMNAFLIQNMIQGQSNLMNNGI